MRPSRKLWALVKANAREDGGLEALAAHCTVTRQHLRLVCLGLRKGSSDLWQQLGPYLKEPARAA